jgi:hypothetical protein
MLCNDITSKDNLGSLIELQVKNSRSFVILTESSINNFSYGFGRTHFQTLTGVGSVFILDSATMTKDALSATWTTIKEPRLYFGFKFCATMTLSILQFQDRSF